jgi:hypothetical protein
MSNPIIISKSIKSNEKESATATTTLSGRYGERESAYSSSTKAVKQQQKARNNIR